MNRKIRRYSEFWPLYVSQHQCKANRNLHFIGTSLALVCLALALTINAKFLFATPVCGYGFAWFGHFRFERNRPATWTHPFWSLIGDFHMYALMWVGHMDREVARLGKI
jgi:hypothetical protein